jgi:hypothetical protein
MPEMHKAKRDCQGEYRSHSPPGLKARGFPVIFVSVEFKTRSCFLWIIQQL